ncbi:exosortase-associated protein EpsI, B-type [Undibacterium parvum]|uniref:EpsI family protein n=2 Tax=Undibacterium TaxID=401469 RepID=A0A6M4A2D4_9BURK|nr:exosortase-associated protein EpsI, B-type [Undibacterium parvum]AZP10948.1 EpsI family protein [Undibacterium parvum]QJQ05516.1 EpsI family protein [Undibacterium piscinae]
MKPTMIASLILGSLMAMSAAATKLITPTNYLWQSLPALELAQIIPSQFGEWTEEKNLSSAVINPQTEASLQKIYTQTLSRTYVNQAGERIMLSIAYGKDQSDAVQVHYPEVCYPAQGFQVTSNRLGVLATASGSIPVKRLETNLSNQRYEPVTYWTTVGDAVITDKTSKKIAEMRYGMKGLIPDGLLFRVSSIDTDSTHAFKTQESFVSMLSTALASDSKHRIMGLAQ